MKIKKFPIVVSGVVWVGSALMGCTLGPPGVAAGVTLETVREAEKDDNQPGVFAVDIDGAEERHLVGDRDDRDWANGVRNVMSVKGMPASEIPSEAEVVQKHRWDMERILKEISEGGAFGLDEDDYNRVVQRMPDAIAEFATGMTRQLDLLDALAPGRLDKYDGRIVFSGETLLEAVRPALPDLSP